ncbi:MAG: ABC transporter permease [Limisphaerales bacterium]|jgi:ABC-2 type transport system permease protein
MQAYWTLVRRELGMYFNSFTGYAVIGAVLLVLGFSFVDVLYKLNGAPTSAPLGEVFCNTFYFWVILVVTAPVITMRSYAAERFSGTYETLMTTPVSDVQVVLAKYSGTMLFYALTWLPLLLCLLVIQRFTDGQVAFDLATALSTYAGILVIGSAFMAMGGLASAVTQSQVLAAILAFGLCAVLFVLGLRNLVPVPSETWSAPVFRHIAMTEHMELFARGVVDSRPVIYYGSLTALFLFLTLKVVESRRWR